MHNLSDVSSLAPNPVAARCAEPEFVHEALTRVLIVDDNPLSQLVTLQQLRQLDCIPLTASSGAAALEAMEHQQFDLVLLDCRMPGIDGYATARAIRKFEHAGERRRCAIVAITGDDDIECVDKCLSAGMDGHLSKPTTISDLRTILERYLT